MSETSRRTTPSRSDLAFYSQPGPMTDLSQCPSGFFDGLPSEPAAICRVAQGLVIHEFLAEAYGAPAPEERRSEVRTRSARSIVNTILQLDPAPLGVMRPPDHRMIGNCRTFTTLSTALLRRVGIPARARCGFASYFEAEFMIDHWVAEYFSDGLGRWVRFDSQVDELQRELLNIASTTEDLPPGTFVTGGEAWLACRRNGEDPMRYGIMELHGLWFIYGNVLRDLAALNKVEVLPWDMWGPMTHDDPEPQIRSAIDRIAETTVGDDVGAIRRLYEESEDLRVPPIVFEARFEEWVPAIS